MGPPPERQGQRRGGIPAGRRRRRGDLRHAGPDPHRPRDPRPRRAVGGGRADGLGLDAGHLLGARRARRGLEDPGLARSASSPSTWAAASARSSAPASRASRPRSCAKQAGAPVKLFLDRKEEQLATGNRPSVDPVDQGRRHEGREADGAAPDRPRQRRHQRRHRHLRADQERLRLRQPQGRGVRRLHQRRPLDRDARARPPAGRLRARSRRWTSSRRSSAWTRSSSG